MKNWRTDKGLYTFVENSKKGNEEYHAIMTGDEVTEWCKTKEEIHGYIPGLGGDKSYSIVAWLVEYI